MDDNSSEFYKDFVSNVTSPENIYKHPTIETVALIISWMELILMLSLNGILIAAILSRPRRNRLSFFVLHLAFTDFGMGAFYLFPDVIQRTTKEWHAGKAICVAYYYISHVMPYVSSFLLVVISFDRLYVLLRPIKSSIKGTRYKSMMIGVSWGIAMLLALPQPFFAVLKNHEGKLHCDVEYVTPQFVKIFVSLFVCGVMFVPTIIIFVCYALIVRVIWARVNDGMPVAHETIRYSIQSALGEVMLMDYNSSAGMPLTQKDSLNTSNSNIMSRARIKSIIMTFVVVTVFVVCWSPFCVNIILVAYGVVSQGQAYYILMALAPLNSAANPIVFMIFNHKMLRKKSVRRQTNRTSTTTSTFFSRRGKSTARLTKDDILSN